MLRTVVVCLAIFVVSLPGVAASAEDSSDIADTVLTKDLIASQIVERMGGRAEILRSLYAYWEMTIDETSSIDPKLTKYYQELVKGHLHPDSELVEDFVDDMEEVMLGYYVKTFSLEELIVLKASFEGALADKVLKTRHDLDKLAFRVFYRLNRELERASRMERTNHRNEHLRH